MPLQPHLLLPQPPFYFEPLMHRSCGNSETLFRVIHDVDSLLPPAPIFVHSERGGDGARYIYFTYFTYFTYTMHNITNLFCVGAKS